MSKFSLYFIMSVLLPGSFSVFVFLLLFINGSFLVIDSEFLTLSLYLIATMFFGVLFHTTGVVFLKLYRAIDIHRCVYSIYQKSKVLEITQEFFEDTCKKHFDKGKTETGCIKKTAINYTIGCIIP